MLFPTVDFAIFFVLVFVGHWLLNHLAQPWKWFMIAASYVFYAWWDWRFVLLLVGVSVLAQLGAIAVSKTRTPRARLVVNGIAVTLLLIKNLDNPFQASFGGLEPVAMERTLRQLDSERRLVGDTTEPPCDERGVARVR